MFFFEMKADFSYDSLADLIKLNFIKLHQDKDSRGMAGGVPEQCLKRRGRFCRRPI